eukprot:TRINITY_DN4614_c0_g3_i1.p1 TRINITY_DN4614_c0_g3~~TRINITY_DN4614_c0_g3_i1.p1  ORF type:complete len:115 (+),score=37.10 TRINITY_DN4614_c0_g3_i1:159-503(+)
MDRDEAGDAEENELRSQLAKQQARNDRLRALRDELRQAEEEEVELLDEIEQYKDRARERKLGRAKQAQRGAAKQQDPMDSRDGLQTTPGRHGGAPAKRDHEEDIDISSLAGSSQ